MFILKELANIFSIISNENKIDLAILLFENIIGIFSINNEVSNCLSEYMSLIFNTT